MHLIADNQMYRLESVKLIYKSLPTSDGHALMENLPVRYRGTSDPDMRGEFRGDVEELVAGLGDEYLPVDEYQDAEVGVLGEEALEDLGEDEGLTTRAGRFKEDVILHFEGGPEDFEGFGLVGSEVHL